jgi:hypothetical protein
LITWTYAARSWRANPQTAGAASGLPPQSELLVEVQSQPSFARFPPELFYSHIPRFNEGWLFVPSILKQSAI